MQIRTHDSMVFVSFFYCCWIRIRVFYTDSDQELQIYADPGINPELDPKYWFEQFHKVIKLFVDNIPEFLEKVNFDPDLTIKSKVC